MIELENIQGIGPKTKELLNKLNINNVNDLLSYYPYRYDIIKRSDLNTLNDGDKIIIDGIVEGQPTIIYLAKNLKKIIFRIKTRTSILNVTVYNQVYLYDEIKYGKNVIVFGKYDRLKNTVIASEIRFGRLSEIPTIESVYHTTSGIKSKAISRFILSALTASDTVPDYLPPYIVEKYNFTTKAVAIQDIHKPADIIDLKKARQRLKYEELFMYMLKINYMKSKIKNNPIAISRKYNTKEIEEFISQIPFTLTIDQQVAINEIIKDMQSDKQMNRLLQGDVGSGKTIVALVACYYNSLNKYQSAIMAPTEILAKQHYETATNILKDYHLNIALLTASTNKKDRKLILEELENGTIDLIIGTQSLIQDDVKFNNLGLVITDEQHRFGVNQRNIFKNKGATPDILSMSATPIPRTYALTIYGDMDVSSIKTKPAGRKEVITYFKKEKEITDVLTMMKEELDKRHQIYVIAPAIENEEDTIESVSQLTEKMKLAFGKICKIASIHGKLDSKEKEKIMTNFENHKIDILISTTVIEVGINVPNASMIVIFDANLFGLSTLHQLRGRVGRSDIQSYCILIAKESQERLRMLEKCNDGFEISEYDFENRGEGDLFGVRQSGEMELRLANVKRDFKMLVKAKEDADEFINVLLNDNDDKYKPILDVLTKIETLD